MRLAHSPAVYATCLHCDTALELTLMVHQPVEIVEPLVDGVLIQRPFVLDDHWAVVVIEGERIDSSAMFLARDVLAG